MKRLLTGLVLMVLALYPVSAQAHTTSVYQGKDYATMKYDHSRIGAFDNECDGKTVQAKAKVNIKVNGVFLVGASVNDSNGCKSGGSWTGLQHGTRIVKIQVCESTTCSAWKDVRH